MKYTDSKHLIEYVLTVHKTKERNMKKKYRLISSLACLIPIPLGLSIWNIMPDKIATHFNFYGNADLASSKEFAFIIIPIIFFILHIIIVYIIANNSYSFGINSKTKKYYYFLMPILSFLVFLVMINNSI